MPITGPPDPETIINAIHDGATWSDGHLVMPRGLGARWLAVVQREDGSLAWALTLTRGVELESDTFLKLATSRTVAGYVYLDALRFSLTAPSPLASEQLAVLMPA